MFKQRLRFFLVWLALGVVPLALRPLWDPDEGRYAEIPREMLAMGDWLTPHLNYVPYFEKPPFQYWLSAISMKLFGESAFAARLPLALAAFITMYAAYRLAGRLGSVRQLWASFAAASCLFVFACGQMLTLDALFSALCVFSLAAAVEAVHIRYRSHPGEADIAKRVGWTAASFAAAACAILTKGPAALVIVGGALGIGLCFALFVLSDPKLRRAAAATVFSPYGWLVLIAIAAPWFVMVERANPGHAHFFFYTEHFERFTTHKHLRQGSDNAVLDKLFFLPVVLAGALPWLSACLIGVRRSLKLVWGKGPMPADAALNKWTALTLLAAVAWPLLFFSASGSKLAPYVLPCMLPLIVPGVAFERDSDGFAPFRRAGTEMLVLGALFLASGLYLSLSPWPLPAWGNYLESTGGGAWLTFLGLLFAIIGIWGIRGSRAGLTAPRWMAWHCAALIFLVIAAQRIAGPNHSIDMLVPSFPADPKGHVQWISHGDFHESLPFLTKGRVVLVGFITELRFGRDRLESLGVPQGRWFFEDRAALTEAGRMLQREDPTRPVWALSAKKAWDRLPPETREAWDVVDATHKTVLLRLL